jgi:hypothetical protein
MEDGDMDVYTIVPKNEKKFYDDLLFKTEKILDTDESETKAKFRLTEK